jgi:hypothetical protein
MKAEPAPIKDAVRDSQSRDTGMAIVLICLLIAYFGKDQRFVPVAALLLIIDMVYPPFFYYPGKLWFALVRLTGAVMPKIVLSLLFYALITPVGVLRRMIGADPMQIRQWKKDKTSVFKNREHTYNSEDIEQPY